MSLHTFTCSLVGFTIVSTLIGLLINHFDKNLYKRESRVWSFVMYNQASLLLVALLLEDEWSQAYAPKIQFFFGIGVCCIAFIVRWRLEHMIKKV